MNVSSFLFTQHNFCRIDREIDFIAVRIKDILQTMMWLLRNTSAETRVMPLQAVNCLIKHVAHLSRSLFVGVALRVPSVKVNHLALFFVFIFTRLHLDL